MFDTYVANQWAYFKITSIELDFVPKQYTETTDDDNLIFYLAIRFGKFEDSNPSLTDLEQIPSSRKINAARRLQVKNINRDVTFYPANNSSGINNFYPVVFWYGRNVNTPSSTSTDLMSVTMKFHVTVKERII